MRWIYFALAEALDVVKIGSSFEPEERVKKIDHHSPTPVRLILLVPMNDVADERHLHRHFTSSRLRYREWYRYDDQIKAFVAETLLLGLGVESRQISEHLASCRCTPCLVSRRLPSRRRR